MIEFKNVNFRYSHNEAMPYILSNLNIDIYDGEFIGLLGANGSGKSTMAKMINCLLVPTSGRVIVNGLDSSIEENMLQIRRKVGFVFQNPENQIVGTIVENDVAFAPENLGLAPEIIEERVTFALDAVGLLDKRNAMTVNLSGGQKQRLAIAGVLAMKPEILVLDEPTAMLDAAGREAVINLIQKINRELKITVVLVTHFMEHSLLCDRIICLKNGDAEYFGRPADFFKKGKNYVSDFNLKMPFSYLLLEKMTEAGLNSGDEIYSAARDLDTLAERIYKNFLAQK
ncbi:MAG: ATP-binding cassette domain-containing protein [Candidatus Wallbacteria bacterium]